MKISVLTVFKSVILVTVLGVMALGGYVAYKNLPDLLNEFTKSVRSPAVPSGQEVIVSIPRGCSLSQVGTILEQKGVISSRLVFKLVALIRGGQCKIKAGDYSLKTGSDAGEVLDLLVSGQTLMFSVTVPEGYNLFQTADLLHKKGLASKEDFLRRAQDSAFVRELGLEGTTLEGYLFPDTYNFRYSDRGDVTAIVTRMVRRFQDVYDKHVRATAEKYGWSESQVVTLASLIEKEARASEHGLVSSVFHNRLRKNMRLQCDPTVIYGIKPMGSKITREDLNRNHPYNTYQNPGLPPGPIANPGRASLIAAIQPDDKPYLYFVAKNDGTHHFSTTLREHNNAVNKYQRGVPGPSVPPQSIGPTAERGSASAGGAVRATSN
ncbi:MAG: endolytic transglycosylase MltG [Desulfomonilaceae bacterium]|nr:endolytic transglycosylase MltG [Desulfomonilaceae bacterium]